MKYLISIATTMKFWNAVPVSFLSLYAESILSRQSAESILSPSHIVRVLVVNLPLPTFAATPSRLPLLRPHVRDTTRQLLRHPRFLRPQCSEFFLAESQTARSGAPARLAQEVRKRQPRWSKRCDALCPTRLQLVKSWTSSGPGSGDRLAYVESCCLGLSISHTTNALPVASQHSRPIPPR